MFPPSGLPYQLFDAALLVVGLCSFWYVFSEPSAVTASALSDTLALIFSPRIWGLGLMSVGLVCAVMSYCGHKWVRIGYALLVLATGSWSISLLIGAIAVDGQYDLTMKALGSVLLFAWITRRLVTEVMMAAQVQSIDA